MRASSIPEPTQQDLEQAATDFAASLLASDDRQYGALQDAPPTTRIATAIADFVTPGDLLKSPSLEKVGRITQSKT
jgi:hypothetical protein